MKKLIFLMSLTFVLMASCKYRVVNAYDFDDEGEIVINNKHILKKNELFVYDSKSECYVFETNSKDFLSEKGYTLWCSSFENKGRSFESFEIETAKYSGMENSGYGVIFCSQIIDETEFLYTVLINQNGEFAVGKVTDGDFEYLLDWNSSEYLNKGCGVKNSIKIDFMEDTDEFEISFNNHVEASFCKTENNSFSGTSYGFVTVISPEEKFPEKSVKVCFSKKSEV